MTPRIGSLFSGYGGLDLGVQAVIGGTVAWHVEFDPAPSKILAHHYPDVPNYGDITTVDWSQVETVDVLTGGFPCQDVSLAGARAGMKDGTRSGLWSYYAAAIDALRPSLVVIENVRGLLTAPAGSSEEWTDEEISDMEPEPWGVGDGESGSVLTAAGAVCGALASIGYDAWWCPVRASDSGAPHQRYRVFIVATPQDSNLSVGGQWGIAASRQEEGGRSWADVGRRGGTRLADSDVPDSTGDRWAEGWTEPARVEGGLDRELGRSGTSDPLDLLPTTTAIVANDGEGVDTWLARRERVKLTAQNGNGMGMPLTIAAALLPTVTTARPELGPVEEYEALWDALEDQSPFWKTADKDYWPAIKRWTDVMGRKAPAPTIPDGKDGRFRLNPKFTEWMMGLPLGWITGCGLTRNEELKACGNGVVWQQAAIAAAVLLGRIERIAA